MAQRLVGTGKHFMRNRGAEIWLGVFLFLIGAFLLYDAFDGRGRKMPWPASAIAPW